MKWQPFVHQNTSYELGHLDPFYWYYTIEATEKQPEVTYKFQVTFSMHCFTRDPKDGEEVADELWYDWPDDPRIFCFDRYELSKQLRQIIESMGERICWHTHHGNFFTIEITTQDGQKIEYEVYFDVTRASRRGWLNLIVQTAYHRTPEYASTQPRKRKISIHVIARNKQKGRPIKPGR